MNVTLISHPENISGEHEALIALFEAGLDSFHIRKPDFTNEMMEEYIRQIPEIYHSRLILHSHFDMRKKFNLKGVHFNQQTKSLYDNLKHKNIHKSISLHTLEELTELDENSFDYALISPVFDSISKVGYHSKFKLNDIKNHFQKKGKKVKVIAMGGVDIDKIDVLKETGFDGIAILGGIWNKYTEEWDEEAIVNHFINIRKKCQ